MLDLTSALVLVLAIVLGFLYLIRPSASSSLVNLTGPALHRWAINGIFLGGLDRKVFHHNIHKLHEKYGRVFHCRIFSQEYIFTADLDMIKHVLRNRALFQNPTFFRKALVSGASVSMFASEGKEWEKKHAVLQPMMKLSMIEGNVRQIIDKAFTASKILDTNLGASSKGSIEILHVLRQVTIDVIGEAAFGVDFGSLKNEKPLSGFTFEEVAQAMMSGINDRTNSPEFTWNLPTGKRKKEIMMSKILRDAFNSLVREIDEKIAEDPDYHRNASDLVSLICRFRHENPSAKEIYPDDHIFGECFSFLGAGHDTTTYAIFWAIDTISRNPRVYSMVQKEIEGLSRRLSSDGRDCIGSIPIPTFAELESLHVLSAAIKESQRLTSFVPALMRETTSDVDLNGLTIPKGFLMLLSLSPVHMSEEFFERPKEMIPERWLRDSDIQHLQDNGEIVERVRKADPLNMFAFGFGNRPCFGRKFALMQIKAVLYVFFQNFHFPTPLHETKSEFSFGVTPEGKRNDLSYERLSS